MLVIANHGLVTELLRPPWGGVKLTFTMLKNETCMQTTTIHSHGFVMAVLQWNTVYKHGEDELHRAPVVALRGWCKGDQLFMCSGVSTNLK